MPEPAIYDIVLRGHPSVRLLRPLVDDFEIEAIADGATRLTRLVGVIGDPAHLHGIVAHLTSVNLEIVSIAPTPSQPVDIALGNDDDTTTHSTTDAATTDTTITNTTNTTTSTTSTEGAS